MNEDATRELQQRQVRLTALTLHPSWEELRSEFDRKKARQEKQLLSELLRGEPLDQRRIDWFRGFWQGAEWILNNPEMAERSFKRAFDQGSAIEALEGATQQ